MNWTTPILALGLVLTACGGAEDPPAPSVAVTVPAATSATAPTSPTRAPATTTAPEAVELDVVTETTAAPAAPEQWEVGGTVQATGPLAGSFDVLPLCDVRTDSEGEFLNVAFGYQDLDDESQPTVRVVIHVRGWRTQGNFETGLEAQYQTGTGMDLALQDAAGDALVDVAFVGELGGVDVARIDVAGSFDGAVAGTVAGELTCFAG